MGSLPPPCGTGGRSGSTSQASLLSLLMRGRKAECPGAALAPGPTSVCSVSEGLCSFGGSACSVWIPFHGAAHAHSSTRSWLQQHQLLALGYTSGCGGKFLQIPKGRMSDRETRLIVVPFEFSLLLGLGAKCRTSWEVSLRRSLCLTCKTFGDK